MQFQLSSTSRRETHSSTAVLALRHCWRIGERALPLLTTPCVQEGARITFVPSSHQFSASLLTPRICAVSLTHSSLRLPCLLYMIQVSGSECQLHGYATPSCGLYALQGSKIKRGECSDGVRIWASTDKSLACHIRWMARTVINLGINQGRWKFVSSRRKGIHRSLSWSENSSKRSISILCALWRWDPSWSWAFSLTWEFPNYIGNL